MDDFQITALLRVRSPPVLGHYSNVVIDRVNSDAPLMRRCIIVDLAMAEVTVMVVMSSLSNPSDGVHLCVPMNERRPGCVIIVPLHKGFVTILDQLGIFHLVRVSSFNAPRSSRTVKLSSSSNWSPIDRPALFVYV